jgi:hypothetical protein
MKMNQMLIGAIDGATLGVLGAVFGVLGGIVGTWFSIRNTNGPRERSFIVRASLLCWLAVTAFLVAIWFIPFSYQPLLDLLFLFWIHRALHSWNRRHIQIRKEEAATVGSPDGVV